MVWMMGVKRGATGIPYVIWKGDRLHYKRRWPTAVRKANPALREFMEGALDTSDLRDALSKASEWNLRFESECTRLTAPSPIDLMKRALSNRPMDDKDRLKYGVERILGPEYRGVPMPGEGGAFLLNNPSAARIRPSEGRAIERIVETFNTLGADLDARIPEGERPHRIREFEAWKERCISQARNVVELLRALDIEPEQVGLAVPEKVAEKKKSITLVQLAEKWGSANDAPAQHIEQYKYACRLFSEMHADVKDVSAITPLHISEFMEQVARMPNSTRKEVRSAKMMDAIAKGEELGLPKISKTTVNKHVSAIKTVLKWGWEHGHVEANAGERIRVKKAKKGKKPKRDFRANELEQLVIALSDNLKPDSDDFWIPLIALLHGARREEVCQLEKADIQKTDDIWCMNIRDYSGSDGDEDGEDDDNSEKSVKNSNSRRLVPLHSIAVRMGFVSYVQKAKGARVFSSLKPDQRGDYGGPYGKRFSRILRTKAKIDDKRVTFHSLRHTFITACRNANMPETMEQTLSGHAGSSAVHDGYGARQDVPNRKQWIDRVAFDVPALVSLCERLEEKEKA